MSDEVFSNLPRSRPVRRSAKRAARPGQDGDTATAKATPAKAAAGKPKVAASRASAADTANAKAASPKATAKASTAAKPKAKATKKAGAARPAAAKRAAATPSRGERGTVVANRGRATRTPARPPSAGTRRPPDEAGRSGTDLVSTAVQAAGELAQVGITLGGQIVKRAVERIPKP